MSKLKAKIHNIVATADLKQKVDATQFIHYRWGTYDIEYYGGRCGYVKDETIVGRVSVFMSGKMISTGAKSVDESITQLDTTMRILVESGFIKEVKLIPKIQNIVATTNFGKMINLSRLQALIPKITYENDHFPAAILRMDDGQVSLMFASGKIVIAGSRSENQISNAVSILENLLKRFNDS